MQECRRAFLALLRCDPLPTTARKFAIDRCSPNDPAAFADLHVFLADLLSSTHLPVSLHLELECEDYVRALVLDLLGRECSNVQWLSMDDMEMKSAQILDKLVAALATGEHRYMLPCSGRSSCLSAFIRAYLRALKLPDHKRSDLRCSRRACAHSIV